MTDPQITVAARRALDVGICTVPFCNASLTATGRIKRGKGGTVYVVHFGRRALVLCAAHLRDLATQAMEQLGP